MSDSLMKKLNQEQLQAVTHQDGPLLIVAGAGTGKTTVLIGRLEYLVKNKIATADEILLLTFTEKATSEMEDRALKTMPYGHVDFWINTFHKFCERLLREHALDIGLDPSFRLLSETDQWILIKRNLDKFNLDYYKPLGNPNKFIFELIKHFSRLKDEAITPSEYLDHAEKLRANQDSILTGAKKIKKKKVSEDEIYDSEVARVNELANAYHVYNQLLLNEGYLDFGDLITYTLKLFKDRKNILTFYQKKFKYIMVDEFQDTNWAQYELLKTLTNEKDNLLVVGDDDQSIYKFRGASLSNIMQFKDDYPKAKEVILNKNYRSGQIILDQAHEFIKHNNPNRLEAKLKINKELQSQIKTKGEVKYINFETEVQEAAWVADKILKIYQKNKEVNWSDFAILVRANNTAEQYVAELSKRNVPNLFISQKGLYFKPIILDCLAYLKLLDNYHESSVLFRVLNMEAFKVDHATLVNINKFARKKVWSLYEALQNINAVPGIEPRAVANINRLLTLIQKHSQLAQREKTSRLFVQFIWDAELNKKDHDKYADYYSYLNQFYQKIKNFELANEDARLREFVDLMNMEMEAGESGSLHLEMKEADIVKVMTVHAAKGLEFDYVFLPNLVDKRFPTITRKEKISIPDEIVREKLPEGKDVHIEEERRLFYVALTRAKNHLFLSGAKDCGGAREKKPSPFIAEAGIEVAITNYKLQITNNNLLNDLGRFNDKHTEEIRQLSIPSRFSFSQIEAYSKCPLQYKFNFILRIPVPQKSVFVFGRVMHNTLKDFFAASEQGLGAQPDLFGTKSKEIVKPSEEELLKIYEEHWQEDGYHSKKEREEYKKRGRENLKLFYKNLEIEGWPEVMFLEKSFSHKIGGCFFKGAIDRVDRLPDDTIEIIDYKTGTPKDKLDYSSKRQLILYKMVMEEVSALKVSALSFYYLENGQKISFSSDNKQEEKLKQEIIDAIQEIKAGNFTPTPGVLCQFCDFRDICEFRK